MQLGPKSILLLGFKDGELKWLSGDGFNDHLEGYNLTPIFTEYDFNQALPEIFSKPPAAVISRKIFRWAFAADSMPEPEDPLVIEQGPRLAGIRCWKQLRVNPATKETPFIFFVADLSPEFYPEVAFNPHTRLFQQRIMFDPGTLADLVKQMIVDVQRKHQPIQV
jgi:hypothetical protein